VRDLTAGDKTGSKGLGELSKGINGTYSYAIKSPYRHKVQTGGEHLAYQGLIFGVPNHPLI